MDMLAEKLKAHRYEWNSLALMARVLALQRRAEFNLLEVDVFHAHARPVDAEWRRRIREQSETLRDIATLRRRVLTHFRQRYHGEAFQEWVRTLFDLHVQRLRDGQAICRHKLILARRRYAR